jgi:hypothetical protein
MADPGFENAQYRYDSSELKRTPEVHAARIEFARALRRMRLENPRAARLFWRAMCRTIQSVRDKIWGNVR